MVGASHIVNLDDERLTSWLVPPFIKNLEDAVGWLVNWENCMLEAGKANRVCILCKRLGNFEGIQVKSARQKGQSNRGGHSVMSGSIRDGMTKQGCVRID